MTKKLLTFFFIGTLIFSLSGCSSKQMPSETTDSTDQQTESETLPEDSKTYEELSLALPVADHEGWSLSGILTLPDGKGPFPAVILVHGSGPSDRDETIYENKPFKDIADGLAAHGIAVYRYDKRTYVYGKEMASDIDLTLKQETLIDASEAVKLLSDQPQIDASRIYVAGHSLGGQAIPLIRNMLKQYETQAAGFIFLAAPARDLAALMREQFDFLYSLTPVLSDTQKEQKEEVYAQLEQLNDLDQLDPSQPILGAYPAYWRDILSYDPVWTAESMTEPCLLLQGEEDYQVTMTDFELWKSAFGEKENWTFQSYPGLTHLFMPGKKENANASYLKKQHVDETVIQSIADFVQNN